MNGDHLRPRGRKPAYELPADAAKAERDRKQARKAKRRNDIGAKRRKGHK